MEQIIKLNEKEIAVLFACKDEIVRCTENDFGIAKNVEVYWMTKNQIKGYLAQLVKKGFIKIYEFDKRDEQYNSVCLTQDGCDFLLSKTTDEYECEQINSIKG